MGFVVAAWTLLRTLSKDRRQADEQRTIAKAGLHELRRTVDEHGEKIAELSSRAGELDKSVSVLTAQSHSMEGKLNQISETILRVYDLLLSKWASDSAAPAGSA